MAQSDHVVPITGSRHCRYVQKNIAATTISSQTTSSLGIDGAATIVWSVLLGSAPDL